MNSQGLVVGTAGHIDHGKTSLVRALTGVDLDTLPEEQERGITIALGFTALVLPDGRKVAFVDVPGHERLVRTMVAGATGIDAVLLCVSAVDGVMPQTREHLAILELLGVRDGAVVLTMADLVDEELLGLAAEDVADVVAGTFLAGKPIVPFSSLTGIGHGALLAVIGACGSAARSDLGPFRLPVDRAFVRAGFGTVVTGTAWSGQLEDGATVQLLPEGRTARVRGIEVHGEATREARAGMRTALNLAGVEKDEVPRGTVVATGAVACPRILDVTYRHLQSAAPLDDGTPVRLLLGTAEVLGRLYIADELDAVPPGARVPAQLRIDTPMPCLPGDRFILRRTSPMETLGGGVVVDPWARRMRKKDREAWGEQVERLAAGEKVAWLDRAGEEGLSPAEWQERGGSPSVGVELGGRLFSPRIAARLEGTLLEALAEYHTENPLSLGAHRRELRRGRLGHLDDKVFDALVDRLSLTSAVMLDGPLVRVKGFAVGLTETQASLRVAVMATIRDAGPAGVSPKVLHTAHPEPEVAALLRLIETDRAAQQVAGVGWIATDVLDELRATLTRWFADHHELTPGDFKELTGLTRKAAIPLLEWLDKSRLTRRSGDNRLAGPALG